LLVDAVIAGRGPEAHFPTFGRGRDDVDDAARSVGPIERGAGTEHHFDAFHGIERHGNVHVVVAGLDVVEPQAVEQDEGLFEGGSANGKVGLHAVGGARLEVERWIETENVGERVEHQIEFAHRQHEDGAVDLFERQRLKRAGDHHGIVWRSGQSGRRGRLLGKTYPGAKEEERQNFGVQ
jgi:hypothetical protein